MGYGEGENAINRWRIAEFNILSDICRQHGIEVSEPQKGRGYSYTVDEYKRHKDTINSFEQRTNELNLQYKKLLSVYNSTKYAIASAEKEKRRIQGENELRNRVSRLNSSMIHQMILLNDKINKKKAMAIEAEKEKLKSEYEYFLKMKEDFKKYAQKYISEIKDEQRRKDKLAELEKQLFSFDNNSESIDDYVNRITNKSKQKQRSL